MNGGRFALANIRRLGPCLRTSRALDMNRALGSNDEWSVERSVHGLLWCICRGVIVSSDARVTARSVRLFNASFVGWVSSLFAGGVLIRFGVDLRSCFWARRGTSLNWRTGLRTGTS